MVYLASREASLLKSTRGRSNLLIPFQRWDNRMIRTNPKTPDPRHLSSETYLWIDGRCNSAWVKDALEKREVEKVGSHGIKGGKPFGALGKQGQMCSNLEGRGLVADTECSGPMCKANYRSGVQVKTSKKTITRRQ